MYLENFSSDKAEISWKKREVTKPHKLFLLSIVDLYLKQSNKTQKSVFDVISQNEGLKKYEKVLNESDDLKKFMSKF